MQCSQFDRRLNELLDARQPLDERALWEHAEQCSECGPLLDSYQALRQATGCLMSPRPQRNLGRRAVQAALAERSPLRVCARMAACAAALAVVVSLPPNFAPTASHEPATAAHAVQKQLVASPSEALLAAGDSWWSMLQETAQPLASAPELIARPDFEAIADAFACPQSSLASWEQFSGPFGDATARAMELFYTIPRFRISTTVDRGSSG